MIARGNSRLVFLAIVAGMLVAPGVASSEEKAMTPLSGGVPMVEGIRMLEPGAVAPDFAIRDTDGVLYDFKVEKGKRVTLLVFWSIFCEPCRFEMPAIQKVQEKYKDSLQVVSIAMDGEPLKGSIVGFIRQEGFTFRVLIDELDEKELFKVADPYGVAGTPTIYIVDRAGKITLAKVGRFKEEEIEKAIQSAMK